MAVWAGVVGVQRDVVLALDKAGLGARIRVAQACVEVVAKEEQSPRELATEVMEALRSLPGFPGEHVKIITLTHYYDVAVIRTSGEE